MGRQIYQYGKHYRYGENVNSKNIKVFELLLTPKGSMRKRPHLSFGEIHSILSDTFDSMPEFEERMAKMVKDGCLFQDKNDLYYV